MKYIGGKKYFKTHNLHDVVLSTVIMSPISSNRWGPIGVISRPKLVSSLEQKSGAIAPQFLRGAEGWWVIQRRYANCFFLFLLLGWRIGWTLIPAGMLVLWRPVATTILPVGVDVGPNNRTECCAKAHAGC